MSARKIHVRDVVNLPAGMDGRRLTKEGYLVAPAHINGTGPQKYTARELGLHLGDEAMDPNRVLTLHRPADEVFKPDVLRSFESKPLTDGHPPEDVTAENWSEYAVGDVRDVRKDNDLTAANVIVRDADMVKAVQSGKAQLSCGYDFVLDLNPVEVDGVKCDGVQRAIDGNHVAIVDRGRAGPRVRIGDQKKGDDMATKKIKVGDIEMGTFKIPGGTVIVADDADGRSVEDFLERHERAVRDALKVANDAAAEHVTTKAKFDDLAKKLSAYVADEESDEDGDEEDGKKKNPFAKDTKFSTKIGKKLADARAEIARLVPLAKTPEQIHAAASDIAVAIGDAVAVIGDEFDGKGKTAAQIRLAVLKHVVGEDEAVKEIVEAVVGDADLDKASEDSVSRAYRAAMKARKSSASAGDRGGGAGDEIGRLIAGGGSGGGSPTKAGDAEDVGGREAWMARTARDSRKGGGAPQKKSEEKRA